jgi:hypothetical protein
MSMRSRDSESMIRSCSCSARYGTLSSSISMLCRRAPFRRGTGQTRRTHVLHAATAPVASNSKHARTRVFHERIADLHRAALLLGGFPVKSRRERRARETVATRRRADAEDGLPTPLAAPRVICSWRSTPRQNAFTSGLP